MPNIAPILFHRTLPPPGGSGATHLTQFCVSCWLAFLQGRISTSRTDAWQMASLAKQPSCCPLHVCNIESIVSHVTSDLGDGWLQTNASQASVSLRLLLHPRLVALPVSPLPGTFRLTLLFTEDYPNKAPTVKFKSTLFHPNSESPNRQGSELLSDAC